MTGAEHAAAQPVNALNANEKVLQCFWHLAAVEQESRLKAVQQLVQDVQADQVTSGPSSTGSTDEQQLQPVPKARQLEHALRNCSPLMIYALRRLSKGLGSGRAASRQGYATALSTLLAAAPGQLVSLLGTKEALTVLEACLDSAGGKGGDARDALLGRLFGLASLVRAGLVRTAADASLVITSLLQLANKKSFLREAAVAVVLELLLGTVGSAGAGAAENGKDDKGNSNKKRKAEDSSGGGGGATHTVWLSQETVRQLLTVGGPQACEPLQLFMSSSTSEATAEAFLLCLRLWPLMPPELVTKSPLPRHCPSPPLIWATQPHLTPPAQLSVTATAFMTDSYLKQVLPVLQSTTSCAPRLHTLWSYLLPLLLPGFNPQNRKAAAELLVLGQAPAQVNVDLLGRFWTVVVDEGLVRSSNERKHLALQLFLVMLPRLPASAIDIVFSKNFSHTLAHSVTKSDTYLHAMAKKVMERVQQFLTRSSDSAAKLRVSAALSRLGGISFQQQAAAKATAGLLAGMDEQGIHEYVEQYMRAFVEGTGGGQDTTESKAQEAESGDEEEGDAGAAKATAATAALERRRATALEQLVAALKFPAASDALRTKVLRFLAACAFFHPAPASETTDHGKKGKDKSKKQGKDSKASTLPEELQALSQAVAAGAPALTSASRQLCAQRLLAVVLHAPVSRPQGDAKSTAVQPEKAEGATEPPTKKQKQKQAAQPAAAESTHTQERDPARLLAPTLDFIHDVLSKVDGPQGAGVALAEGPLPEESDVALTVLRELEDALQEPAAQPGGTRARAFLRLAQLLQLHVLGTPATAAAAGASTLDTSLIYDLRRVTKEAVGLSLADLEEQSVDEDEGESEKDAEKSDEEDEASPSAPAWSEVLLDVLLSLLSQPSAPLPSAPLRTACEAVWKQCCDALTQSGMQDLLRVVAAPARKAGETDEDDDVLEGDGEEEEEEEVEEEVGGSESDEDGDDSGSDTDSQNSEDAMDAQQAARIRQAMQAANGKVKSKDDNSDSDDSDDEDSDPADDEEMFRMDAKISAYLRAVTDKRKSAKEAAAAMQALQFRALTLLETFATKCPSSPLLLLTPVRLLRALAVADRLGGPQSDPVLAQRLTALLTKTIFKAKPTYDASTLPTDRPDTHTNGTPEGAAPQAPAPTLQSQLHRLLYLAGRSESKATATAAGAALGMVLRSAGAATEPGARSAAEATYLAALTDFMRKKTSRLSLATVEAAGCRGPLLGLAHLPFTFLLKEAASTARNIFKQVQAIQLVAALLKGATAGGPSALTQTSPLTVALRKHASAMGAVLEAAACGAAMKTQHHADALKAAVQAAEVVKKVAEAAGVKLAELLGPERIHGTIKAIATVRDMAVAPRVNTQLSRLAQVLNISDAVKAAVPDPALRTRLVAAASQSAKKTQGDDKQSGPSKAGSKGKAVPDKKQKQTAGVKAAKRKADDDHGASAADPGRPNRPQNKKAKGAKEAGSQAVRGDAKGSKDKEDSKGVQRPQPQKKHKGA